MASNLETVRAEMLRAFEEAVRGVRQSKTEDELLWALEIVASYPAVARVGMNAPGTLAKRLEAMRAAVKALHVSVGPIDPTRPAK